MATVCFLPSIIFWKYEIFDLDEVRDGESDGSVLLAKCFESRSQVGGWKDRFQMFWVNQQTQVGVAERVESHNSAVAETEKAVKEIQEDIFTSVFDSIVNFVVTAAAKAGPVIPTAVLLTGVGTLFKWPWFHQTMNFKVNMPDHSNIFSLLLTKLESVSPHTSLVGPGLNLRSLVTQVSSFAKQKF